MTECSRPTCFVPDTGCDLGHSEVSSCPAWAGKSRTSSEGIQSPEEGLLPWSASALGLADLGFVAGRTRPIVVGIIGPQNAGKTTILAAWYLLMGRGATARNERRFAGSYSLAGWEAVAGSLRWHPGQSPTFPPHTSSRGGRAPGLLHLTFRENSDERLRDFLFTDAPGEWFQKWAVNRDSPDASGARWVSDRADVLALVADREALAGENMGTARNAIQLLARRLAAERGNRPTALIWSKSDIKISSEIESAVRNAVKDPMPDAVEFSVSIIPSNGSSKDSGDGLLALLNWILGIRRESAVIPPLDGTSMDPLFLYGARGDRAQ